MLGMLHATWNSKQAQDVPPESAMAQGRQMAFPDEAEELGVPS